MTRSTPVRAHTRKLPDKPRLMDNTLHQNLQSYVIGNECLKALEQELATVKAVSRPLHANMAGRG